MTKFCYNAFDFRGVYLGSEKAINLDMLIVKFHNNKNKNYFVVDTPCREIERSSHIVATSTLEALFI